MAAETAPIELKEGMKAPAFSALNERGERVALKDFKGKQHVVLYFYPKDDTPGCTTEACGFRDGIAKLTKAGAVVLGVSRDSVASHKKFQEKFQLPFSLLADEDEAICKAYGTLKMKNYYGIKKMGVARMTFLIDKDGTLRKIFPNVKPEEHPEEVLEALKSLNS